MSLTDNAILEILDVAPHPLTAAAVHTAVLSKVPEGVPDDHDETVRQIAQLLEDLRYRHVVMVEDALNWQKLVGDFPGVLHAGRYDRFYASTRRFLEWTERVVEFSADGLLAVMAEVSRPQSIGDIASSLLARTGGLRRTITTLDDVWRYTSQHHLRAKLRELTEQRLLHVATGAQYKEQGIDFYPYQVSRGNYWCTPQLHRRLLDDVAARRDDARQHDAQLKARELLAQRHPQEYEQLVAEVLGTETASACTAA